MRYFLKVQYKLLSKFGGFLVSILSGRIIAISFEITSILPINNFILLGMCLPAIAALRRGKAGDSATR